MPRDETNSILNAQTAALGSIVDLLTSLTKDVIALRSEMREVIEGTVAYTQAPLAAARNYPLPSSQQPPANRMGWKGAPAGRDTGWTDHEIEKLPGYAVLHRQPGPNEYLLFCFLSIVGWFLFGWGAIASLVWGRLAMYKARAVGKSELFP